MHIDKLEIKWATVSLLIAGLFVSVILASALFHGIHAPSNVETIDSARLHLLKNLPKINWASNKTPTAALPCAW